MVFSIVDNGVDWINTNKEFIMMLFTMGTVALNFIASGVRIKKIIRGNLDLSGQSKVIGKIIDERLSDVLNKVNDLTTSNNDLRDEVKLNVDAINKLIESDNEKNKLIILLLQTANIPLNQKQTFYTALNSKGEEGVKLALKSLETSITQELDTNKVNSVALDNDINDLKVLNK